VSEEAGIEDFRLIDGFRKEYDYVFEANGNTIHKTVHLFIARSFEASAEISNEHRDLQWRDYDQALNTITQTGPRDLRGRPRLPRRAERRGHRRVRLSGYSRSIPPRSLLNCRRLPQP